ncbi:MAG: hypothetical protein N0A00_05730 [Candidatus Bathyarchaeota archaeon]|nr:hypothetical protein [Candidatus Bathyarchaeota archaeon]
MSARLVAFVGVFAALHVVLYFMSFGLWRNWAIYIEPMEGVVLGPWAGFLTAFIGSVVARAIKPIDVWMFGVVAEPLGVLAAGFLAKGKWKPVLAIYAIMLAAYFAHPFGTWLPIWTILDILLALALIYPSARLSKNLFGQNIKLLPTSLILLSFVATVTDSLTRVFLLIPVGLYNVFGWPPEAVYYIFIGGAIGSYIEDMLVVITSLLVGVPLLIAFKKLLNLKSPLS